MREAIDYFLDFKSRNSEIFKDANPSILFDLYIGQKDGFIPVDLYYLHQFNNPSFERIDFKMNNGEIGEKIISDDDTIKIQFNTSSRYNKQKIYIHAKNVKNVLNENNCKYIKIGNKIFSYDEFKKDYGNKIVPVSTNGNILIKPFLNYNNKYVYFNLFYNSKVINDLLQEPSNILVKTENIIMPVFYSNSVLITTTGELAYSSFSSFSFITSQRLQGNDFVNYRGVNINLNNTLNDLNYEPFIIDYTENGENLQYHYIIDDSLYIDKLPLLERAFLFSDKENPELLTDFSFLPIYTKSSIEEYLNAFGINYEWVYDVDGDDDIPDGTKIRRASLTQEEMTDEVKKVRRVIV